MNDFVKVTVALLLAGAIGYGLGRYVQPAKIETKVETVVKEVETVKKDIRTVETEIHRPDGTVEKQRITEDKSQEIVKKDTDTKKDTIIENQKAQWRAQLTAQLQKSSEGKEVYGLGVERRILGPVFLGLTVNTDQKVGASLGFEF